MAEFPQLRTHRRLRKDGTYVTYYFYDRRAQKLPDIPLGTDYAKALAMWQDIRHDGRPGAILKKSAPKMLKPAVAGKRRKIDNDVWQGLPAWGRRMFRNAEKRAAHFKRPFALTIEAFADLIAKSNGRCAVTGVQMDMVSPNTVARVPLAPSLDRIDSRRGYVPDNVRLVCMVVNLAMSEWGEAPLLEVFRHMQNRNIEAERCGTSHDVPPLSC